MKKITSLFISIFIILGASGCSASDSSDISADTTRNTSVQTTAAADGENSDNDNLSAEENTEKTSADGKTLVVYYSASGNTRAVAETIAEAASADIFELIPTEIYTDDDLDWTDDNSRVSVEHDDPDKRDVPLTANTVDNWSEYDTVFIGYPIWWGIAAWPVDNFIKANDFSGKNVIPFCTSASSKLGESGELLAEMAGTGKWLEGERFRSGADETEIKEWVKNLKL